MSDQTKRLERALRSCAERGVPADSVDLWPAVRGRVRGEPTGRDWTSGTRSETGARRPPRPVLGTPLVFAIFSMLILGVLVYVAAGPIRGPSHPGPPPGKQPGPGPGAGQTGGATPEGGLPALKTQLGQTRTMHGEKVTLDWAYADEAYVAVGLHTQHLADARRGEGSASGPAALEPALWDDTVGDEAKLPPHVRITDASGQDFDLVGGGITGGSVDAVFDAPEGLRPGPGHRFRLEVPLATAAGGTPGEKPAAGPFFFDFEAPVRPAPTIEVDQESRAEGVTLTLERVIDSPANPQAEICGVPDDGHRWTPWLERQGGGELASAPHKLADGCWSLPMGDPVRGGRSSVTVERLESIPTPPDRALAPGKKFSVKPKIIRGPWTFEFETPGP